MQTILNRPRLVALALTLVTCAAWPRARAAVASVPPRSFEQPAPPECEPMRDRIMQLDEIIARLPEVRAIRESYDASELGHRERAAMEAMNDAECFADSEGRVADICDALMAEVDACATAFENSVEFKRVMSLPVVVEFDRLNEQFSDLCAAHMPAFQDGSCDWEYEEDTCEAYDDDMLPGTV